MSNLPKKMKAVVAYERGDYRFEQELRKAEETGGGMP